MEPKDSSEDNSDEEMAGDDGADKNNSSNYVSTIRNPSFGATSGFDESVNMNKSIE